MLAEEHTPDGTRMRARVGAELATAVLPYAWSATRAATGRVRRTRALSLLVALAALGSRSLMARVHCRSRPTPEPPCAVDDPRLDELSGMVVHDGGLWAVSDGGRRVQVHRLDRRTCAVIDSRTADVDPYDVEDLAVGPDGALWVADIGDNDRRRDTVAASSSRRGGEPRCTG